MLPRMTVRFWLVLLSTIYFLMLFVFHGRLQLEMNQMSDATIFQRIISSKNTFYNNSDFSLMFLNRDKELNQQMLESPFLTTAKPSLYEENCFLPSNFPNRTFQPMEPNTFVYSAYLDERQRIRYIRVMTIHSLDKKNRKLEFFCTFPLKGGGNSTVAGSMYELCENHGRRYGGFMVSCEVPQNTTYLCTVNVSMAIKPMNDKYVFPHTKSVTVPVSLLRPRLPRLKILEMDNLSQNGPTNITINYNLFGHRKYLKFNFTLCIPPLFGKVSPLQIIEWIEVHRLLGVQHFIFYIHQDLKENKTMHVLEFYRRLDIVTLVSWRLPGEISAKSVWYYGQLSAHNDCMYRAMSFTQYLAIIDIDEVIVPHGGAISILAQLSPLFKDNTCGLSLSSAFYDRQFMQKPVFSDLMTMSSLARSGFSHIRKKVVVVPTMVFEVGIHHISKPAREWFHVTSVDSKQAFLHHYRRCVPNYGMKCVPKQAVNDTAMLKYNQTLRSSVRKVFMEALSEDINLR